jgi:hypothetical protein
MATAITNTTRTARGSVRETRSSKLAVNQRRSAARASKLGTPPWDMQLPILKRIAALLMERKDKAMEMGGKKGHGLIRVLLDEQLPHFRWLTRNMLDHYILTYSTDGVRVPKIIIAQEQTIMYGLTDVEFPVRASTPSAMAMSTTMSANTPGSSTTSNNKTVCHADCRVYVSGRTTDQVGSAIKP